MSKKFEFPSPIMGKLTLRDAISDLCVPKPAKEKNKTNGEELEVSNHEYMNGGFSSIYMSRNRVRSWDEPSFTIQAGGRHAPTHLQALKMRLISENKRIFEPGYEEKYRRLSAHLDFGNIWFGTLNQVAKKYVSKDYYSRD